MKDRKLATRYARALLGALPDDASRASADTFLRGLAAAIDTDDRTRETLNDPATPRSARLRLLQGASSGSGAPAEVERLLRVVVDHGRIPALPAIASMFHDLLEASRGIVPATITTAKPLDPGMRDRARSVLEKMTGKTVRLECEVDETLVGGAVTRIGSTVYDGSLRTQLDNLKRRMVQE